MDTSQLGVLGKRKLDFTVSDGSEVDLTGDDHDGSQVDISQHINDEIDLEVAIRERLATTIGGRIQWALQMLDALSNAGNEPQGQCEEDDFEDAALDALEALEAPSSFLFDTGLYEERSPSHLLFPTVPNPPPLQRALKTRSSRTPKPSQQEKYLYIKLPPTASIVVLACPTCNRTQFTTLQGLLNHARLSHNIEWASHDACIAACAVHIPADSQNLETCERDGVEVPWGDNVVGLRRLFERAVGVDGTLPTLPLAHIAVDVSPEDCATAPSTLLSRTLGLHADTPALAQFLGRAPKRRCIHVHDEDQHVDIIALDDKPLQSGGLASAGQVQAQPKKRFNMRYLHRNTARKDLDLVLQVEVGAETTTTSTSNPTPVVVPVGSTATRFHITARIRLEDRSLFLKEDRRTLLSTSDQYRWMLGVTAPSYSLPLSSFLTCVTVIPPRTVSPVHLTVQQQPFAIVGTANEPFMARVVFEWVGGGKMEVEHWVELDQSKCNYSALGSEQLFDVELDRSTPLLPVPKGSPPSLPSLDRLENSTSQTNSEHVDIPAVQEEYYEQVLRNLLPRVPMTARDVKPRMATQVTYKLMANPAHLLALVPGRRKAIEWARARSLHALYVDNMSSAPPCQRTTLTVGDVYKFLEDDSHFPRPSHLTSALLPESKKRGKEKDGTPSLGEEFCPTCGIKKRLHLEYDVKTEDGAVGWTCAVVPPLEQRYGTRFPLVNLTEVLTWPGGLEQVFQGPPLSSTSLTPSQTSRTFFPPCRYTARDLATLSPPDVILAVHRVVSKLRLPAFPSFAPCGDNAALLDNRELTERALAPAALLSATLKPFISTLLRSGVEIAKWDATSVAPGTKPSRGKKTKKLTFVLTPGHILRGLRLQTSNSLKNAPNVARAGMSNNPRTREPVELCLARLGIRLESDKNSAESGTKIGHTTVKAETE